MLKEFKEFALKGNVIDMAVGVIIGGAFSTIVSSLVNDIFMPVLGLLTGKINFSELYISLDGVDYPTLADAKAVSAPVFAYGSFIQNVIQFLILAFVVFLFMKVINKLKRQRNVFTFSSDNPVTDGMQVGTDREPEFITVWTF